MVEYTVSLDSIFNSLADPIRRDIVHRVSKRELSVSEIAKNYEVSLAAISKHLKVLERARLIIKRRRGKQQMVQVAPLALKEAAEYLEAYRLVWEERHEALDTLLKEMK
jgi:DNA-binding transcriptional ArsR family regulator